MPITAAEKIRTILSPLLDPNTGKITDVAINGDKIRVLVTVDPAIGAGLEPLHQKLQNELRIAFPDAEAQIILTAERSAPPALKDKTPQEPQRGFSHKISNRPVAPGVRSIIAVASGKGGVGKSTVAVHLARAFAALGQRTGLLDADIYGASQPLMMGLSEKPQPRDDGMIPPLMKDNIAVMSMGFFVDAEAPIIWRGPMVHSAIQQLLRDVDWGDLDVLVIDLPPGTGDAQLSLAQYVPLSGAVIVSTPQKAALTQAKKGLKMFEKTKVQILGVIENMRGHGCSKCGHVDDIFGGGDDVRNWAEETGVDYLGAIPLLTGAAHQMDKGLAAPALTDLFAGIAARLSLKISRKMPKSA